MKITTRPGLWDAARANDVAELERLLDLHADIELADSRGFSPLMLAVYAGSAEAAKLLLARGANPNSVDAAGNTPLMGAAFKGYLPLMNLLLDSGADPSVRNLSGGNALEFANMFGQAEAAALLQSRLTEK